MTQVKEQTQKNLSDTRGNALGIGFFRLAMKCCGIRFCYAFVWCVAAYYALFDKNARLTASTYLKARFPNASKLKLRMHLYKMLVAQGQAIVLAHWLRSDNTVPTQEHNPQLLRQLLENNNTGLILLISHAGCWQAALTYLNDFNRTINLLIQANANPHIAKMFTGDRFRIIDNDSPFGGLLDCLDAIQRGEIVCIMGDRPPNTDERTVLMTLTNRKIVIPESPWFLAARAKCPIVPVFTMMTHHPIGIDFHFATPIIIPYDAPRKPSPEYLKPFIQSYADTLDDFSAKYPYQIFHYDMSQLNQ